MNKIINLLLLLLFTNTVNAQNICDPGCSIDFVFTNGGTIAAVDAMSFTFGAGSELNLGSTGTVNTAVQPANLDFSAGGVLVLLAGESITFDSNGSLLMAQGSNLDAVDFDIIDGDLTVIQSIEPAELTITGRLNTSGALIFKNSKSLVINSDILSEFVTIFNINISTDTILSGTGRIIAGLAEAQVILNSSIIIYSGSILIDEVIGLANGYNTDLALLNGDVLALDIPFNIAGLQGVELVMDDGVLCTISGNECITENGEVYLYGENGFVKQAKGGGGSLNTASLLIIFFTYYLLNIKRNKRI